MVDPPRGVKAGNLSRMVMRMNAMSRRSRPRRGVVLIRVLSAVAVPIGIVAVVGCSSSKPAYCTDRTNLQNSVNGLTSSISSRDFSSLKSEVDTIKSSATTLVNSAKSDFPDQTSAITSSVNALKSSVAALPSSPSAADIVPVTRDAASVVSSIRSFRDASKSKCS